MLYGKRIFTEHFRGEDYYQGVAKSLIRHALHWLKTSNHTQAIQFVVYEESELEDWDVAMNTCMGRSPISAGTDEVLKSLCQDVTHRAHQAGTPELSESLNEIASQLGHLEKISIEIVCASGRKLVEKMLSALYIRWGIAREQDARKNNRVVV